MQPSREARLLAGITLLTVPAIMYGGIKLLGILTTGTLILAIPSAGSQQAGWL